MSGGRVGVEAGRSGRWHVCDIDDILILALFFGQAAGDRAAALRVVVGQYLGFAILTALIAGALGAGLLPDTAIPYLGLLPLLLGIRAACRAWQERHDEGEDGTNVEDGGPGVVAVAAVTFPIRPRRGLLPPCRPSAQPRTAPQLRVGL